MTIRKFLLLLIAFIIIFIGFSSVSLELYWLVWILTVVYFCLLAAIAVYRGILSSGFVFFSLLGLFHFGLCICYILVPQYLNDIFKAVLSINYINEALIISLTAATAFFVGYMWSKKKYINIHQDNGSYYNSHIPWFWVIIFILFASVYCIQGFSQGIFFSPRHVYITLSDAGNARVFGLFRQLMILVSFVLVAKIPNKYVYWIPVLVVFFLSPMIISGKRGEFITILAAYAVIFPLRGIKVSKKQLIVGLIILVPLMSILRIERGGYVTQGNPVTDLAMEGGAQIRTVAFTVDALNRGFIDHKYGATYLNSLTIIVPNIGNIRGTILPDDKGPAEWFTEQYNNGGSGIGYSIVAEAYLNGGIVFVALFMATLGYMLFRFELAAGHSQIWLALFGAMLMSLFWWIRNDSGGFFRPIFWVALLFYMDYLIKMCLRGRGSA